MYLSLFFYLLLVYNFNVVSDCYLALKQIITHINYTNQL